jgi:hypothetical protein
MRKVLSLVLSSQHTQLPAAAPAPAAAELALAQAQAQASGASASAPAQTPPTAPAQTPPAAPALAAPAAPAQTLPDIGAPAFSLDLRTSLLQLLDDLAALRHAAGYVAALDAGGAAQGR